MLTRLIEPPDQVKLLPKAPKSVLPSSVMNWTAIRNLLSGGKSTRPATP
jgi:hypothetical protein